jgi:hypothetical protein
VVKLVIGGQQAGDFAEQLSFIVAAEHGLQEQFLPLCDGQFPARPRRYAGLLEGGRGDAR